MSKLRDDAVAQIDCLWNYYKAERALADDLAATLTLAVSEKPSTAYDTVKEINRVLARYREARQR